MSSHKDRYLIPTGKVIHSKDLMQEFLEKEMNRRRFIAQASRGVVASAAFAALPGCETLATGDDDDSTPDAPTNYLVGMGSDAGHSSALEAALNETIGRDGLSFISEGDVVYFKVNSNSGDFYPYSTAPRIIELLGAMCLDQGASQVIVGDRSFWGDQGTLSNLTENGVVGAVDGFGDDRVILRVFDDNTEWVAFPESDAPDWVGGFSFPREVVEADHIINLPIVKTHFIATFTMGMKNIIGLVNAEDRRREGNLRQHVTSGNKLYKQIAQINRQITPSLTVLDGHQAVIQGGPTVNDGPGGEEASPELMIVSTDRIAADITGLAILKTIATANEDVHDYDVWDNPQIVEAVAAGVGISGPDEYEVSGPTVSNLDEYVALITG